MPLTPKQEMGLKCLQHPQLRLLQIPFEGYFEARFNWQPDFFKGLGLPFADVIRFKSISQNSALQVTRRAMKIYMERFIFEPSISKRLYKKVDVSFGLKSVSLYVIDGSEETQIYSWNEKVISKIFSRLKSREDIRRKIVMIALG